MVQSGPKWSNQVFLIIWDHFGPIWTPLDHFRQKWFISPQMDKAGFGRGAPEQKIILCLQWSRGVQMGPFWNINIIGSQGPLQHLSWVAPVYPALLADWEYQIERVTFIDSDIRDSARLIVWNSLRSAREFAETDFQTSWGEQLSTSSWRLRKRKSPLKGLDIKQGCQFQAMQPITTGEEKVGY